MTPTPNRLRKPPKPKSSISKITELISQPSQLVKLIFDFFLNSDYTFTVSLILLPLEIILNLIIVLKIPCKKLSKAKFINYKHI